MPACYAWSRPPPAPWGTVQPIAATFIPCRAVFAGRAAHGECHLTDGEPEAAITHLRHAVEIYKRQRLGMTRDTDRVRGRLHKPTTNPTASS